MTAEPETAEPETAKPETTEPETAGRDSPPSRRRRVAYWAVTLVVTAVFVELTSALCYLAFIGDWPSGEVVERRRDQALRGHATADERPEPRHRREADPILDQEVLHPYLGYVRRPHTEWVDSLGLSGVARALEPDPGERRVAIFGGSLAAQLCGRAETLLEELSQTGWAQGREVVIACAAVPGYKQPQQLMTLSYLLSLGASLDLVINIDGFNEVHASWFEYERYGTAPSYPQMWTVRTSPILDSATVRTIGALAYQRQLRSDLAEGAGATPWRHSTTATVGWLLVDRWLERRIDHSAFHLSAGSVSDARETLTRRDLLDRTAALWARSSEQMAHLARGARCPYFHFLQPNQHVSGSKPLSDEERRERFNADNEALVTEAYVVLSDHAPALEPAGAYHSLSGVFSEEDRTVYDDDCCHLNELGLDSLGQRVGEIVRRDLESRTEPR